MSCKTSTKKCPKNVISNVESELDNEHNTISNKVKWNEMKRDENNTEQKHLKKKQNMHMKYTQNTEHQCQRSFRMRHLGICGCHKSKVVIWIF